MDLTGNALRAANLNMEASQALTRGEFPRAVELAEEAIQVVPEYGWAHYTKGAALVRMARMDEGLQSLQRAEQLFVDYPWARSVALYRHAHALNQSARCAEAEAAFRKYAVFVEQFGDEQDAQMALNRARTCTGPGDTTVAGQPEPSERQPVMGEESEPPPEQ